MHRSVHFLRWRSRSFYQLGLMLSKLKGAKHVLARMRQLNDIQSRNEGKFKSGINYLQLTYAHGKHMVTYAIVEKPQKMNFRY